jgi:hypothetical protein
MKLATAFLAGAACALTLGASGAALAQDVIVVHPRSPHVLRVKPASYIKQYPFGRLREDYTPYGMYGVRDRDYFDVIEGRRAKARRVVVRAAY